MISKKFLWYQRDSQLPSGLWVMAAYESAAHPDGTVVAAQNGQRLASGWAWRTFEVPRGIVGFELDPTIAPTAPPLWFVNVDESKSSKPATHLVGFTGEAFPAGTIISRYTFATAGVHNDLQVGAVHWYRDGIVHQIFVAKEWRRRFVATTLLGAADAFHQANGWPGHLRSDGRRTDLGKLLAAGIRHPQRFAPLKSTMPPMDPEAYAANAED